MLQETELKQWEPSKISGVFSKLLIQFPEGTGKLIQLKSGSHYPRHQHPDRTEYAYVLQGNPLISVGEDEYHCKPGDFVTIPAEAPHSLQNEMAEEAILFVGAIIQK